MEKIQPLALPENFDPQVNLISQVTENGTFHESRRGAGLAYRLVANGAPEDLALAEKVLDSVLACQERRPEDPHCGNFYWMYEDDVVFDLNAVEFCLEHLIPMMIEYGGRLNPALRQRVLDAIRLGLREVENLNVLVAYTNIAVFDILNSALGGELLGDERIARRGYAKMLEWMAYTDESGIPQEYNSPTYTSVVVRSLHLLERLVKDAATRGRARLMAARLGLSIGLHIHPGTGRWAGPHSRAYQPSITCDTPPEIETVRGWIAEGALPGWVEDLLSRPESAFQVHETAASRLEIDLTTYQAPAFALGTASRESSGQTNTIFAHYTRPGEAKPGVIYCRYLFNDKWLGDFYHATDRTKSRNLLDEGRFFGVQSGQGAIGLYTVPNNLGFIRSAKAVVIFQGAAQVEEIWIGGQRVTALPAEVPPGMLVVIGSGGAYTAVLPLSRTDLGRSSPIRLVEIRGDLVLEIYNYLGTDKPFWELGFPGAFYKGKPKCGFYLEMADRKDYPDGKAFGEEVERGSLSDLSQEPYTYAMQGERTWQVEYSRGGRKLGIEIDLMEWKLKRRWTERGSLDWEMLESPLARQNRSGRVAVDGGVLECGKAAAWLFHSPADPTRWVAGYHGREPAPFRLSLPGGSLEIDGLAEGVVVWEDGKVQLDANMVLGEPRVAKTG